MKEITTEQFFKEMVKYLGDNSYYDILKVVLNNISDELKYDLLKTIQEELKVHVTI